MNKKKSIEERLEEVAQDDTPTKGVAKAAATDERYRQKPRGRRLNTWLTVPASRALDRAEEMTGARAYDIMSTAIVLYTSILEQRPGTPAHFPFAGGYSTTPKPRQDSPTTRDLKAAKVSWCEEFGGKVDGNVCFFDKYEVTLAGTTDKMKRSVSINEIPNDKEEFKKMVLGGYDNVYEARRALTNPQ